MKHRFYALLMLLVTAQAAAQVVGLAQTLDYQGMKYNVVSGQYEGKHTVKNDLLLSDGSIRQGWPSVPVEDFNAPADRNANRTAWGKFSASVKPGVEGTYTVTWADGKKETLKLTFLKLAAPGQRVEGTFLQSTTSGEASGPQGSGSQGSAFVNAWNTFTFTRDGRFSTSSGAGVTSSSASVSTQGSSARNTEGTYTLSGNTLTLRYASGEVQRLPFAFLLGADKGGIYLAGRHFTRR